MPGLIWSQEQRDFVVDGTSMTDGTADNQIWLWHGGEWKLAQFRRGGNGTIMGGYEPDGSITAGTYFHQYKYFSGRYHLNFRQASTSGISARDIMSFDWFSNTYFYDRCYFKKFIRVQDYIEVTRRTTNPGPPGFYDVMLYHFDNSAGKRELRVRFPNGTIKVLADDT